MNKIYNPKKIEEFLYLQWEKNGFFKPNNNLLKDSYCIVIPPPNITGTLHMGHALQQTIMDVLVRYNRMKGKNTLWQTGTDHAGIATQIIIEKKFFLKSKNLINKNKRNFFIKKAWEWKNKSVNNINYQMKRLGNSIDWTRDRFTLDKQLSIAVKKIFIKLYEDNLIYRGKRLVNWDNSLCTAISDLEIEFKKVNTTMWFIKYKLDYNVKTIDGLNYIVVATTRPETILGDIAIAVKLEDSRYKNLIGKFVTVPIINRRIPIIGDKNININKNTECIKISPGHDFNDYEFAKKHLLPIINIFTFNGKIRNSLEIFNIDGKCNNFICSKIPNYLIGLNIIEARKCIIKILNKYNFIIQHKKYLNTIPYSDRSNVPIEPMLTNQWYIRMSSLSKEAIKAVKYNKIKFIPKKYENIFFNWMYNIKDWCISRQIWWGHRIPAWYDIKGKIYVGNNEKDIRKKYNLLDSVILNQEKDVLDTWFSSALWSFSSLGWPNDINTFNVFHPVNVIVSGFDIIFFWISRMIMLTMYCIKNSKGDAEIPFKTVYITGLICDENGKKMSKSKGNIIDPIDLIDGISLNNLLLKRTINMIKPKLKQKIYKQTKKIFPNGIKSYGTDALRFTLSSIPLTIRKICWEINKIEGYYKFCNKLWNAGRFIIINTKQKKTIFNYNYKVNTLPDHWIKILLNKTIKLFRNYIDNYRIDLATNVIYEFIWYQFCDWYLEFSKIIIKFGSKNEILSNQNTLLIVFENILRLLHPIIPFITEKIWQYIKKICDIKYPTIMLSPFPNYDLSLTNLKNFYDFEWIKIFIVSIRNIFYKLKIISKESLKLFIIPTNLNVIRIINNNILLILNFINIKNIIIIKKINKNSIFFSTFIKDAEIIIKNKFNIIDKDKYLIKLNKKIFLINKKIDFINLNLSNKNFINKAPKKIVDKNKKNIKKLNLEKFKILNQIKSFSKK